MHDTPPRFEVIGGKFIHAILAGAQRDIIGLIRHCYLAHHRGRTENPDSHFLRFRDKPEARIIALPAAIKDEQSALTVSGIKWIASYPRNIETNLQRASAVLLLNDYETGYPFACLEASQISAARTAASAVLAAAQLGPKTKSAATLALIGGGPIARTILSYFAADNWQFERVLIHDISAHHRDDFIRNVNAGGQYRVEATDQAGALQADIVVLATTAGTPWIPQDWRFTARQLVLNVSLRDIAPETLVACNNVLDDVEHCMKANTSPHLAEQRYGHREFIVGTLAEFMEGEKQLVADRPVVFSPFGLGVLDLGLAMFIYQQSQNAQERHLIPGFFHDTQRWPQ